MNLSLEHYLVLSAVLFSIGLYGVLSKRNAVVVLMCIEIMLNAVNIALVAFSRYVTPLAMTGQVFTLFILIVAAAGAAVGVAIIISIFRNRSSINLNDFNILKW
ncbi:MAG TPA: NADH-quinone oxidoreductase subunit NuoK [Dehalococcoidales bacterium]|nr:NADH-quinone oxidoreductase subunit NuoK [Dehalococcoidales bacterium]